MEGMTPPENLPQISTVEGPATFISCGGDVFLSYEVAPVEGAGVVILSFSDVVHFEKNPNNIHEGLRNSKYPVSPWGFTEILGSDRNERWSHQFNPRRFWTISFNDWTVEIVFSKIEKVFETRESILPDVALLEYLSKLR